MLLGEYFGRRHERALPAGVDGSGGRECCHHRLARADVALQQPVHWLRLCQVARNFGFDPVLRGRRRERQRGEQPGAQAIGVGCESVDCESRRNERSALAPRHRLRELLREQLFELEPLPRRVAAVFKRLQVGVGQRLVQKQQRLAQARQARRHAAFGQEFAERRARQRPSHRLSQIGLGQLRAGRVDGRERGRQRRRCVHHFHHRMHHLAPEEAATQLAAHAQTLARRHGLLLRGVEVEEAQHQLAAAVLQRHEQLAARALLDAASDHHAFNLHRLGLARLRDRHHARLVFIAQRQVQGEVDVAQQAELFKGSLGAGFLALRHGGVEGGRVRHMGHGTILPACRNTASPLPTSTSPCRPN